MRILLYNNKPVEEIGYVQNEKVVFLRYLRDEDKPRCECGRVIEKDIDIVEGCNNWNESVKGVDTIPSQE
jgi:hypothetical protein